MAQIMTLLCFKTSWPSSLFRADQLWLGNRQRLCYQFRFLAVKPRCLCMFLSRRYFGLNGLFNSCLMHDNRFKHCRLIVFSPEPIYLQIFAQLDWNVRSCVKTTCHCFLRPPISKTPKETYRLWICRF